MRRKYSRCCFWAPPSTSSRIRFRTTSSVRRSCWSRSASFEPLDHVERLEELNLLRDVEVRRIAGRVRQRAGTGDRAQERADPPIVAAKLEDFFDHGAVLALELTREVGRRHLVGPLVDRDAEHAFPVSLGSAGNAAMQPDKRHRGGVAGQPDPVRDLGDDADAGEAVPLARHQQHTWVAASLVRPAG